MSKARNMARMGQDTSAGYTGAFDMPAGTTAERPASAGLGWTRLNTDTGSVEVYDGTNWNAVTRPFISGVTGTIYAEATSNLVVSGQNFTSTITVRFLEGGSTVADVTGVSVSSGSATVAVPAAVYGQTAGDTIEIKVINSDGTLSANGVNKTVQALPTGGTITTSGSYRIHTFTSSSSLVVPSGLTLSNVEYVVVAGGGGGGSGNGAPSASGGGGGAGGYRSSVTGEMSGGGNSAESKLTLTASSYTVTIGAGGTGVYDNRGNSGSNTVFGSITSLGGSGGGCGSLYPPTSGGSGGGGDYGGGGAGTSGQGYAGGAGRSSPYFGGGGGGAGQTGRDYNTNAGRNGDGGYGVQSSINGTATWRAGGGGSGVYAGNDTGVGLGGSGGGGNGGKDNGSGGSNGSANTGGGGGGGPRNVPFSGGSGIVIVRYAL
jgi:hypothetical protein